MSSLKIEDLKPEAQDLTPGEAEDTQGGGALAFRRETITQLAFVTDDRGRRPGDQSYTSPGGCQQPFNFPGL
jgi:hypothetical protein